ncbi:MAG: hypothetical protein HFJ09_08520 [Lachnospiraceae bacterium]|nr:hypothetical protein [Lachnospiraceae bacterium]
MKITELESRLENLESDLQIILETVDVIEISLSSGILKEHKAGWALTGVIKNIDNAIKEVETLAEETINIRSNLENLKKEGERL